MRVRRPRGNVLHGSSGRPHAEALHAEGPLCPFRGDNAPRACGAGGPLSPLYAFGVGVDGAHLSLHVCCLIEPVLDPDAVLGVEPTCVCNPVARSGESLENCAMLRGR